MSIRSKPLWLVWLEIIPLGLLAPFIAFIPYRWGLWVAGVSGGALYWLLPHYRHIARCNLRIAFGDQLSDPQVTALIRASWANAVKTFFEFMRLGLMSRKQLLRYSLPPEGYDDYLAAAARGRGVIAVACHLGNWYWPVFRAAAEGHKVNVIVRPLDNPILDHLMNRIFARWSIKVFPKGKTAWTSISALRNGETLAIMADLNAHIDGIFVPFFGVQAATMRGVATLRKGTGAEIIIVSSPRGADALHPIKMQWIRNPPLVDAEVLMLINQYLERLIGDHPADYFWIQARWKKRPKGELDLYE